MKATTLAAAALCTTIAGAAVLALNVGSASATANAHDGRTRVVQLTLRYADANVHFIGKDASKPTIGDEFIDTIAIRERGAVVGRARNICTIVGGHSEATFVTHCTGTYTLHRGEIVTAGTDDSSDTTTDAVVGGTGAFARAAGTATTTSGRTAATVTIRYVVV